MGRLYGPLRILLVVLAVLTITSSVAFAEGEDEYYLTWEEYITANEIESWNWNDAADAIEIIANHAIELYEAGDQETAYEYAKAKNEEVRLVHDDPYSFDAQERTQVRAEAVAQFLAQRVLEEMGVRSLPVESGKCWDVPEGVTA